MSLGNAVVRVDASRQNSKLVAAGPASSPDERLSSCSMRSWNDGRPRVVPWGASMSFHSVSRAYKKPVFALSPNLE